MSTDMNPALVPFGADFIIHADKTSAKKLSYVQLHQFEASVSLMQDGASRPKPGIRWIQAYLQSWMQFFKNKSGENVEGNAKSGVQGEEAY